jgi:hypothetical protein
MITSTKQLGIFALVDSLFIAIFNQDNHDRKHKLWNIVSTERHVFLNVATHKWEIHNEKIVIISLSKYFIHNRFSHSISRCMLCYETELCVTLVSFISQSME